LAALLVLAACGGGSDEAAAPPISTAPTPGPTPTPTPVPTPTPSASYAPASDFTRDRSFTAVGVTQTYITGMTNARATLDPESGMIGFDYIAATRRYRARYQSDAIDVTTVPKSSATRSWDEYEEPGDPRELNGRYFGRTDFRTGQTYSGFALWREGDRQPLSQPGATTRIHRLLFGARTEPNDIPTSGTATYKVDLDFSLAQTQVVTIALLGYSGAQPSMSAQAAIDWTSRRLTGRISVAPFSGTGSSLQPYTIYTIEGTVSSAGRLSGTLIGTFNGGIGVGAVPDGTPNGFSGTLDGYVYGPKGGELGFLFTLAGANSPGAERQEFVGAVLGKQ
jgi:hypothetical protein